MKNKTEILSAKEFRAKYAGGAIALPASLSHLLIRQHKSAKKKKPEQNLQKQLCQWLKLTYPNIYFMSDASGLRVNMGLRSLIKQTRSRHAALDLVILHPKYRFDGNRKSILYCGLIIELKKESPFKKDGSLKSDEHLQ